MFSSEHARLCMFSTLTHVALSSCSMHSFFRRPSFLTDMYYIGHIPSSHATGRTMTSLARAMRAAARAAQAEAQATGSPPAAQASSTSGSAPHPIPTSDQGEQGPALNEQGPALNVMWDIQEHRYPNIGQALDTLLVQATDPSGFWPNGWPDELSPAAHSLASNKDEVVKVSLIHHPLESSRCSPSCTHATLNHDSLHDRCGMASAVMEAVKLLTTCILSLTSSTHTRSSLAPSWWQPMRALRLPSICLPSKGGEEHLHLPSICLPSKGVEEHLHLPSQGVGEHLLPVGGSTPAPSPCPCPKLHPDALCSWRSAIRRAAQW